jgi:hypothetical protein
MDYLWEFLAVSSSALAILVVPDRVVLHEVEVGQMCGADRWVLYEVFVQAVLEVLVVRAVR